MVSRALPATRRHRVRAVRQGHSTPPTTTFLAAADGSWCEIDQDSQVWEAGPHQLWRIIEDAHSAWITMGRPGW
ncbi:MAG: hypothetical protein JO266_14820 [Acidobacteria bacterium]|nr:hypothetical protein [Acidobacteriota bacterium]